MGTVRFNVVVMFVPGFLLFIGKTPLFATPLTFANLGLDGQTTVFRAPLGGLGLTQVGSVTITDSNSQTGGSPGVFSGFDLDFVFLDVDGIYATTGDRIFGSVFAFTTGTIRPTADPDFQPTASRPGPTSGSLAANVINFGLATLNTRDGFFPAAFNTDNVFGYLTLGDGGSLGVGFAAPVPIGGTEALFVGEVGTQLGELLNASATASESELPTVPEPASITLLGLGLAGLGWRRRRSA